MLLSDGETECLDMKVVLLERERDGDVKGEAHWKISLNRHIEGHTIGEKEVRG